MIINKIAFYIKLVTIVCKYITFVSTVGPSLYPICSFNTRKNFGSSGLIYDILCFFLDIASVYYVLENKYEVKL